MLVLLKGAEPQRHLLDKAEGGEDVVQHCKDLSLAETYAYIDGLGKAKRFHDLAAIYNSGEVSDAPYAATVHVRELDTEKAIALFNQFRFGSPNYHGALSGLAAHPRAAVIGYFKKAASSSDPMVRAKCYRICMAENWGELVDLAKDDLDCTLPLIGGGWQPGDTLGSVAQSYLKRFCIA
jgi:hypothetical protein